MTNERYKRGSIECIEAIREALSPEEFRGFCKGNVLKYTWRERYKGGSDDLKKARDYLDYIEEAELKSDEEGEECHSMSNFSE